MNLIQMHDIDLSGKRVLIREDLNVPIKEGIITSDQRLQAALPTIKAALDAGAAVMVISHLGRPEEGKFERRFSMEPIAQYLEENLDYPVRFVSDYLNGLDVKPGELVVCENVRFNVGEKNNDEQLAKNLPRSVIFLSWTPLVQRIEPRPLPTELPNMHRLPLQVPY